MTNKCSEVNCSKIKYITSFRKKMKMFVDLVNEVKIFNEKIPYVVSHRNNLSNDVLTGVSIEKNIKICEKEITRYVLDKLNSIDGINASLSDNKRYIEVKDSKENVAYIVAYLCGALDEEAVIDKKLGNVILLQTRERNTFVFQILYRK